MFEFQDSTGCRYSILRMQWGGHTGLIYHTRDWRDSREEGNMRLVSDIKALHFTVATVLILIIIIIVIMHNHEAVCDSLRLRYLVSNQPSIFSTRSAFFPPTGMLLTPHQSFNC